MTDPPESISPTDVVEGAHETIREQGLTGATFEQIGGCLSMLAQRTDLFDIGEHRGRGINAVDSYVLYRGDGLDEPIIILAAFDRPTHVHNHGTWGVMCAYKGRERYQQWRRTDEGIEEGKASLELVDDRELAEGDVVWWPDPPHDIHRQEPLDGVMWQLVLMGRNAVGQEEDRYDPEAGTVRRSSLPATGASRGQRA